ncbi:hypothetical protein AWC38_SpisGene16742 [Stylophora pistillata]|uniref:Seven cysteines N-terminal domain-containing protein n=1 Tax=Stylophora pistillata TaxID=50429 RepID=A0A2B4RRK1_STYPI|nr:hypothetical protein AWC38_SpisGene16742 [Stylophora pistillata]
MLDFTQPPTGAVNCKKSAIIFNATLVNGNQSGKFVDHGDLGTIAACQDMCCQSPMCDVAFLAGKRCFSVFCHSEAQCLWEPAKESKYVLQLSYIHSAHSFSNSGRSLKASHPTGVAHRVEADARPINKYKTEREPKATSAVSDRTEKEKKLPMLSPDKTKDGRSKANTLLQPGHSMSLVGNTVRTMSHWYVKDGRSETRAEKATAGVSHNRRKAVSRKAFKGGDSTTARGATSLAAEVRATTSPISISRAATSRAVMPRAAKSRATTSRAAKVRATTSPVAISRAATSRAVMPRAATSRATTSRAATSHTTASLYKIRTRQAKSDFREVQTSSISAARKELKEKGSNIIPSRRRISTTTVVINASSAHASPLLRSSSLAAGGNLSASKLTTPGTSRSLKKSPLAKVKTEDLIHVTSRAVTITMVQKVPTQGIAEAHRTIKSGSGSLSLDRKDAYKKKYSSLPTPSKARTRKLRSKKPYEIPHSLSKNTSVSSDTNATVKKIASASMSSKDIRDDTSELGGLYHLISFKDIVEEIMVAGKEKALPDHVTTPLCHYGHVYYNYSLLHGRKAGNFTNQGKVEDMSECLRICWKEPSCKLALMLEQNCYSVSCQGKFCQTMPVNPLQFKPRIAHVIRPKVLSNTNSTFPFSSSNPSHHPSGGVSYNVTLRQHQAPLGVSGGKAGHRSLPKARGKEQISQVDEHNHRNDKNDTQWNNQSKFPYKVFEISSSGKEQDHGKKHGEFSLREFDRLDTLLNLSLIHKQRALYIAKYLVKIGKTTMETGLRMVQIHGRNKTQHNNLDDAVKIGRRLISAGEKIFSRGERVLKNIMNPGSEKKLKTHRAKIPATRISEIPVVTPVIKMISLCSHGPSYYGVTLLGGFRAGHFVGHGQVDNMQACIKKCCANQECDLAFMVREDCYSVICYHKSLCQSVRANHVEKYQPRIAHIWRGSNHEGEGVSGQGKSTTQSQGYMINSKHSSARSKEQKGSLTSQKHVKLIERSKMVTLSHREHEIVNGKTVASLLSHIHANNQLSEPTKAGVLKYNDSEIRKRILSSKMDAHSSSRVSNTHSFPSSASFEKQLSPKTINKKQDSVLIKDNTQAPDAEQQVLSFRPKVPSPTGHKFEVSNSTCPHSAIQRDVGLRRGLKTGRFAYIGELTDITKCLKVCCRDRECDVAFMLDESCYTVTCANKSVCHSVPYHQHQYSTSAVFVYGRFHLKSSSNSGHRRKESFGNSAPSISPTTKATLESIVAMRTVTPRKDIHHMRHSQETTKKVRAQHSGPSIRNKTAEKNVFGPWVKEDIKVNLTGAREFLNQSKKYDSSTLKSNFRGKTEWKVENIKIHLSNNGNLTNFSSAIDQNPTLTNPSDQVAAQSHLDTRDKVPEKNVLVNESPLFSNYSTIDGGKRNVREGKVLKIREGEKEQNTSLKIRINFNTGSSLFQGEPDYNQQAQHRNKSLNSDFYQNLQSDKGVYDERAKTELAESGSGGVDSFDGYESGSNLYTSGSTPDSFHESAGGSADFDLDANLRNCSTYSYHNVTLRGGLNAGNFTFVGKVASTQDCATRCCSVKGCDVTLVVLNRCFLVDCFSDDLCDIINARNTNKFKPVVTYVNFTLISDLVGKSFENSTLASDNPIQGDNETGEALNSQGEATHYIRVNVSRTIEWENNTRVTQNQDSVPSQTKLHPSQCIFSLSLHNVSFRIGRRAGIFTNHGSTKNISECAKYCCLSLNCDVAFMISDDCFFVRCHSDNSCETRTIQGSTFNPRMIFVEKHGVTRKVVTQKVPNGVLVYPSKSSRWSSHTLARATLLPVNVSLDLLRTIVLAPSFYVPDMTITLQSSIGSKSSAVSVKTAISTVIPLKDKGPKIEEHVFDPSNLVEVKTNGSEFWWQYYSPDDKQVENSTFTVAMPTARNEISATPTITTNRRISETLNGTLPQKLKGRKNCNHARIVNGVTLTGGYYAGIFTKQENVASMRECVSRCCSLPTCNVAFMVAKICYAVQCFSKEKCNNAKAHYSRKYHPQVSYVRQGLINIIQGDLKGDVNRQDAINGKLRCVLEDVNEPKHQVKEGAILVHSTAHDLGDCAKLCCQTEGCEVALQDNGTCYSLNCLANLTCSNANLSRIIQASSRSLLVIKGEKQSEKYPQRNLSETCHFSRVLHEVVLRGGSQSGKFKYLTEVDDMATCIKECCKHSVCDLALMLKDNCFLVSCHSDILCEPIRSRSSDYHPQIAYKIKPGKDQHIEIWPRREKKSSVANRHIYEAAEESNTENATFTMGRFFPVSSVKVGNIHSNGSGFVDIANNSKTEEEMTSNDTVLVSNETETDIFANETTPQYVLMSHPLLTLNDSSSLLGGKSTLAYLESSPTVKKTVLLPRVVESRESQVSETVGGTMIVNSLTLSTVLSVEKLKPSMLSLGDDQLNSYAKVSSLLSITETSDRLTTSPAAVLQSLKYSHHSKHSQQSSILPLAVGEGLATNAVQMLNHETEELPLETIEIKSPTIQTNSLMQLDTVKANLYQANKSKNAASTLKKRNSTPSSTSIIYSSIGKSVAKEGKMSWQSQIGSPGFSTLQKDKTEVTYSLSSVPFTKASRSSIVRPQTTKLIRAEILSSSRVSSKPTTQGVKQSMMDVSSNVLAGQVNPTLKVTVKVISLTVSPPTPTGVLLERTEQSPVPSSLSLMEPPTSLLNPSISHTADLSLISESNQVRSPASKETKPFNVRLTHSSSGLSLSLVSPTPSAIPHVSSNNPVNIKVSSLGKDEGQSKFSKRKEERDEIPVITPRLQEIPSLSDVSPSKGLHLTYGFSHDNKGAIEAYSIGITTTTASVKASSSLPLTQIASIREGLTILGHLNQTLILRKSQVATEKSTSITLPKVASVKRFPPEASAQTSLIASKNSGIGHGRNNKSGPDWSNIERQDLLDAYISLTKEASYFNKQDKTRKPGSSITLAKQFITPTRTASATSALPGPFEPKASKVKQLNTVSSHQTNGVQLGQLTTSLLRGDNFTIATTEEKSTLPSLFLPLNITKETETTIRNVIVPTASNKKKNIKSLTSSHVDLTGSSRGISSTLTLSKQMVLKLANASRPVTLVDYSPPMEKIQLLSKKLVNINSSSKKNISSLHVTTRKDKRSNSTVFTTTQAKALKADSKVLLETPFSLISTKTESSRISVIDTLNVQEVASKGNRLAKSSTVNSTSVAKTLGEAPVKMHSQEKVVRTLANGIVSSPVFHHAINHIGELLKNETEIADAVSRLESLLGHLQTLVVNETRHQLNSSTKMSPLKGELVGSNGSGGITRQVASKLDGISSKLRRISSVLTELQIKRKEHNDTVEPRSNVERPGNLTKMDKKNNNLIALLLKRFTKLEAIIQRKRSSITGSSLAKSSENKHTASYVIHHTIPQDLGTMQLQTSASHSRSALVSSPTAAGTKVLSLEATPSSRKITITPLISKELATNQPLTTMKSTSSISTTPLRTKVTSPINNQHLNLLQTRQIKPLSTSHLLIQPQNNSRRQTATSLTGSEVSLVNPQSAIHRLGNRKTHHVDRSKEFTYVTFRNGIEAGIFTESGKMKDMESCVERCYNRSSCHVAFMVEHSCYSIHCYSQKTCEVLPVQTPIITTRVVYLKDRMLELPYSTTKKHKPSPLIRDDKNFTITN